MSLGLHQKQLLVNDLTKAMEGLIKLRQYYINKANGRSIRLVGGNL